MGEHFESDVLGDSEIIVSAYALRHLGVPPDRKHKVELYFDVINMFNLFTTTTGGSMRTRPTDREGGSFATGINSAMNDLFPTTDQMINMLKDSYGLHVNDAD